jgi:hypothetical protein
MPMTNFKGIHLNLDEFTNLTHSLFEFKTWNNPIKLSKFEQTQTGFKPHLNFELKPK